MSNGTFSSSVKEFTILIVDDEQYVLDFLSEALQFWGYKVITASDSHAALEMLKNKEITLLITDIKMEADDAGLRLITDARSQFPELIIILITGSFVDERTMKFCEQNSVSFLQKPLRANELKVLINNTFIKHLREIEFKSDIQAAKKIIENTFPKSYPKSDKFDLFSLYKPVFDIGGDFYDFIDLKTGRFLLYLCDVQGHGIHAAIFANTIRIFLRAFMESFSDLSEAVSKLNDSMCQETRSTTMATAFFTEYNSEDGVLTYVNAGHEHPILYRAAQNQIESLDSPGMILAIFEGIKYEKYQIKLNQGDILFIYTDGVCDNYNINYQSFSIDRVRAIIQTNATDTAENIGKKVFREIQKHLGGNPQHDDLAFILLKVK